MNSILSLTNLKFLLSGLGLTLYIALVTILLSLVFGIILAMMKRSSIKPLSLLSNIYIEIFRNTPLLLWILAIRFIVRIGAVNSGILALTLFTSAIVAEVVRGGLNSIKLGQFEAAYSQGFNGFQTMFYIILPQAIRNMLPSLLSQFITVVKDTSFLWAVGIEELTGKGMILMGSFATADQVFLLFGLLAFIYFSINFTLALVIKTQASKVVLS